MEETRKVTKHSFMPRFTKAKGQEKFAFYILRTLTYFVLFCAGYLFWDIVSKGSSKVFEGDGLLNWEFLTEDPQTLHVVTIGGEKQKLSSRKYYELKDQLIGEQFDSFANSQKFEGNFSSLKSSFVKIKKEWADQKLEDSFKQLTGKIKSNLSGQFTFWRGLLEDPVATATDFEIPKEEVQSMVSGFVFANINKAKSKFPLLERELKMFKAQNFQEVEGVTVSSIKSLESEYLRFWDVKLESVKMEFQKKGKEVERCFVKFIETKSPKKFIEFEDAFTPYLTARLVFFEENDPLVDDFLSAKQPFAEAVSVKLVSDDYAYSGGGIFPAIVGTFLLVLGAMLIAIILGVLSAVFLAEYGKSGPLLSAIRLAILNLAGVPSIIFGLFGFGLFVIFLDWNVSLLAGWFTLAFMVLPVVITSSEEALRSIPQGFREASLALGASKWTMIRTNVIPYAMPGILTSSILGVARAAGETAPIMFTAAYAKRSELPWENLEHWTDFFFQGVMALPYHIYVVSAKIPQNEYTVDMQYGTAFVFLLLVLGLAMFSILLRTKLRKKYRW